MDENTILVESKPAKNDEKKVRLVRPAGVTDTAAFRGLFNRYCLRYTPGEGFSICGEYQFYYDLNQHYVYGVCPTCGAIYIKPMRRKRSRRLSEATRYRGTISRRALAQITGGMF